MSRRYAPREPYTGPEGPDLPEHLRPVRQYKSKAFVLSKEVVVLTKGAMKVPAEAIIPREKVETWYDKALAKQEEKVEGV